MTDPAPRRVGDRERLAVQDRLRDAYAQGALTTDEFEDRLSVALSAVWTNDLTPLVADLPEPRDDPGGLTWPSPTPSSSAPPSGPPSRPVPDARPSQSLRGLSAPFIGGLVVLAAVLGITTLDVGKVSIFGSTQVEAEPGEEVRVLTIFGSTEVVVPAGVEAESDVVAVFGSSNCEDACRIEGDTADTVQVDGMVLFGSIEILSESEADRG